MGGTKGARYFWCLNKGTLESAHKALTISQDVRFLSFHLFPQKTKTGDIMRLSEMKSFRPSFRVVVFAVVSCLFCLGCSDNNNSEEEDAATAVDANEAVTDTVSDGEESNGNNGDGSSEPNCPEVADNCPDGCYEMTAREYDLDNECYRLPPEVIGCSSSGVFAADVVCLKSKSSDSYYLGPSSYLGTEWVECDPSQEPDIGSIDRCEE